MITEYEKEAMRVIEEAASELAQMMMDGLADRGVDVSQDGLKSHAAGMQLATYDALFAIREKTEWRGISDPSEIARRLLRDVGIGE